MLKVKLHCAFKLSHRLRVQHDGKDEDEKKVKENVKQWILLNDKLQWRLATEISSGIEDAVYGYDDDDDDYKKDD